MNIVTRRKVEAAGLPAENRDTRIASDNYPICSAVLNVVSSVSDPSATPGPGDISLCAACGTILCFDDDMRHRIASQKEINELEPDQLESVHRAQSIVGRISPRAVR